MEFSKEVKDLIRDGIDMHLHSAPDLLPRKANDIEFAKMAKEYGMSGFVIKSHYTPTAERASLVRYSVEGFKAYGSIVLNNSVGGINPVAVEVSAKLGAKVVWMPTVDSPNERGRWKNVDDWSKAPYWARLQKDLKSFAVMSPVNVWDEDGELLDEVYHVFDIIKEYNMILATGHLSPEEGIKLVRVAYEHGIRKIIITHPDFPSTLYTLEQQKELLQYGVMLERCFTTPYSGKTTWDKVISAIRTTGPSWNIISTDLGQPNAPYPVEGMLMFAERLLQNGFTTEEIQKMIVDNPKRLLEE